MASGRKSLKGGMIIAQGHALVTILEMLNHLYGVEVEDGLADSQPMASLKKENSRGIPQIGDRWQPLHISPFDRFELDRDRDERPPAGQSGVLAGQLDVPLKRTVLPAQAPRGFPVAAAAVTNLASRRLRWSRNNSRTAPPEFLAQRA